MFDGCTVFPNVTQNAHGLYGFSNYTNHWSIARHIKKSVQVDKEGKDEDLNPKSLMAS